MRYLHNPFRYCCLLIFALPLTVTAQFDASYLVLSTQAQVNAFNPADLQGRNLAISGNDITQLSALAVLDSLPGTLAIHNNPLLSNLDGLKNLRDIHGYLSISGNGALTSINGFDSLRGSSSIRITDNPVLSTITGFPKLSVTHDDLSQMFPSGAVMLIAFNPNLISLSGFNGLERIRQININDNPKLQAVTGFKSLTQVQFLYRFPLGGLYIQNNAALNNLSGFSHLTQVSFFTISGNNSLTNVDAFSSFTTIATNLTISNNAVLTNLDGLTNLKQTASSQASQINIDLTNNPLLTRPCGIYPLLTVLHPIEATALNIKVSGSGFTLTQLLSCGDFRIPITPEPSVYLAFNEANGVAPVTYGSFKDFTFKRSPNLPASTANVPVQVGGANAFDFGVVPGNNYVESSAVIPYLSSHSFTLTGWINCKSATAGSGGNRIISWINNGGDGVDLVYQSNGSLRIGIDQWPDYSPASSSPNKVTTNTSGANSNWVFFAVTYVRSTNEVKFYFGNNTTDATLDVTRSYPRPISPGTNIGKLAIGAFNDATRNSGTWDRMFRGMIDNVHIFTGTVLDQEKIVAIQRGILNADVVPPTTPTNLRLISQTGNNFTLAWDPSVDDVKVKGYNLQATDGFSWAVPGDVSTYTIEVLPNTSRELTLIAFDDVENFSPASNKLKVLNVGPLTPLVRLSMDEGPGIAPQNSGSLPVTFTRSSGTPQSNLDVPLLVGGAYSLDFGTTPGNYYVQTTAPVDALKNMSAFTLTGWINVRSFNQGSGGNRILSWINNGGDGVDLVYQNNGTLRLGVDGWPDYSPAISSNAITTDVTGTNDNWKFFAVTYQSNGQVQYFFGDKLLDATLDVTRNYPGPGVTGSNIGKLAIGAFNDATRNPGTYDRMFRGLLDDLRIYGSVISPSDIVGIQRSGVDKTPPSTPQNFALVGVTSSTVELKWDASVDDFGVKQYEIIALPNNNVVATVGYPQTSTIIAGLTPGTTYEYTMRAKDFASNVSPVSNNVTFSTTDQQIPQPLVWLKFNESSGNFSNDGSTGGSFARSGGSPLSTSNTPGGSGGGSAIDFGIATGNYYVQSTSTIDGLKNLNSFTLTGWINNRSNVAGSGGNRIISWINNGVDGVDLVYQSNGSLRLGVDGWPDFSPAFSSANRVPTNASAPSSNWVFFAVTYQSNGQVQFYFGNNAADATLDVTKTYNGPGLTGGNINKLAIGAFNDGTRNQFTYDRMFRGLIDEIQVFGTVLTPSQIVQVQDRNKAGNSLAREVFNATAQATEMREPEIVTELYQNFPNPFADATQIDVTLRNDVRAAHIMVSDVTGRPLRYVELNERGSVHVDFSATDLRAGLYIYTLVVDGKTVGLKRMVISK